MRDVRQSDETDLLHSAGTRSLAEEGWGTDDQADYPAALEYHTGVGAAGWPWIDETSPLSRGNWRFFAILGLGWGTMTAFGGVLIEQLSGGSLWAGWVMAAGLGLAVLFSCLHARGAGPLVAPLRDFAGLMVCLHALAALVSGVMASSNPLFTMRFIMLTAAMGVVLYTRDFHPQALAALRAGLTAAGLTVCLYNMQYVPSGAITNSSYRLNTFLNASANGIIAAMAVVSLLEYAMSQYSRGKLKTAALLLACTAVAAVTVFLTRSRTATAAALVGVFLLLALRTRVAVAVAVLLACALVAFVFDQAFRGAGQTFADLYQLGERGRGLDGMSGRIPFWGILITKAWLPNPVFGGGPGFLAVTFGSSSHNALLYYLSELGVAGTSPLIAALAVCFIASFVHHKDRSLHWAIAIFAAALTESFAESELFSFGNPGSLLFLGAVAALVGALLRPRNQGNFGLAFPGSQGMPGEESYDAWEDSGNQTTGHSAGGQSDDCYGY